MKRTFILMALEGIIIVGLLVPVLALAQDNAVPPTTDERVAALQQQVTNLQAQVSDAAKKVVHTHLDAHTALQTPVDDPKLLPTDAADPWVHRSADSGYAADPWVYRYMDSGTSAPCTDRPTTPGPVSARPANDPQRP